MSETPSEPATAPAPKNPRRSFLKRALAVVVGGVVSLFPAVIGLLAFVDPLKKRTKQMPGNSEPLPADMPAGFVKVTSVDSLPDDGTPRFARVIADRMDAWTYFPQQPIGSIFLRKLEDGTIVAFNTTCPHAGCAVDYRPGEGNFFCPCHNSSFAIDGERSPTSPSARDLDDLDVKVLDGDVWVKYVDFHTGTAEREEVL